MSDDVPEEEAETPSTVDPNANNKIRDRQKREADEAKRFWSAMLAHPVGRREIWRLLRDCHTFEERFACGPNGFPQPEATWFEAGQQAFGQRLFQSLILMDREATFHMMDEHDPRFAQPKRTVRRSVNEQ